MSGPPGATGQDPVGKRLKMDGQEREIAGVVGSVEPAVLIALLKGRIGQVYVPVAQQARPAMSLVVRTPGDPAALIAPMRNLVREMDIDQPVFQVRTLEEARAASRSLQLLATWLLGGFAVLAMLLAAIGIYGLISYSVGQRRREFGIRISLGAQPRDLCRLAVRQCVVLIAGGVAVGLAGAFALTRLMSALLYGVGATDPLAFAGVTALLGAVGLLAGYFPARRAGKVDPILTLRCE